MRETIYDLPTTKRFMISQGAAEPPPRTTESFATGTRTCEMRNMASVIEVLGRIDACVWCSVSGAQDWICKTSYYCCDPKHERTSVNTRDVAWAFLHALRKPGFHYDAGERPIRVHHEREIA